MSGGEELRTSVLRRELENGQPPETIARKYPDLWPSAAAVHAAMESIEPV